MLSAMNTNNPSSVGGNLGRAALVNRQRILTMAFLFPGPGNPAFNRVVALASSFGTCHVELVFEDDMAFSIFAGSKLFFKPRSFSNPEYQLISICVSQAEYTAAYNYCQSCVSHDIEFTDAGMYAAYFQPQSCPFLNTAQSTELGYTFCSKIVTETLQFAGVPEVDHLTPCTTTPSMLFGVAQDSARKLINSVAYKRERLVQEGVLRGGI